MRYIQKNDEPDCLKEYKDSCRQTGERACYANFGKKKELNYILRAEQHGLCCYCQRVIDHFDTNSPLTRATGSHNEHLHAQSAQADDDLDYNNIYACCVATKGLAKRELREAGREMALAASLRRRKNDPRHCGEIKGNNTIVGSIQNPDCEALFNYSASGEILPGTEYKLWRDFSDNLDGLTTAVKERYDEIDTLNLNCNSLISDRKEAVRAILNWMKAVNFEKSTIQAKIQELENRAQYVVFHSAVIYYLRIGANRP